MKTSPRALKNALPLLAFAALLPALAGCPGIIEIKSAVASGPTKSTVPPILYEDFEQGVTGSYTYGPQNAGASIAIKTSDTVFHSGHKSMECDYQTGTGTYGPGFGFGSNYLPKVGYFDARGTLGLLMWVKAPRGLVFQVCLKEGSANGADGEFYLAPQGTGTGEWARYIFPYSEFTRNIYAGNQAGDDIFEVSALTGIQIQLNQNQGNGKMYIDDVYFR